MFDNTTEKTLRLIAAAIYLKQSHGVQFAFCVLTDAGFCQCIARAALQDEQDFLGASSAMGCRHSDEIPPE